MKKILLTALCVMLLVPTAAFAAVYYVAPGGVDAVGGGTAGAPFATISYADASGILAPGDTVQVAAGTYTNGVYCTVKSAGVTYQGVAGQTIVNGSSYAGPLGTMTYPAFFAYATGMESGIKVDGFNFIGGNGGWYGAFNAYCCGGFEVSHCYISAGAGVYGGAMAMVTSGNNFIHNNVIDGKNTSAAFWSQDGRDSGSHLFNNTLIGTPGGYTAYWSGYQLGYQPGLGAYDGQYDQMYNNILYCPNTIGEWTIGILLQLSGDPQNNPIILEEDNNLFYYYPKTVGGVSQPWNWDKVGSDYATLLPLGPSSIKYADPMLVDPANGDYHLAWNSPAIDTGIDTGLIPFSGSAPDIGAFETPEPGSMLAMFSGLVGLVGFGIRRRK